MSERMSFIIDALEADTDCCILWPFAIRKNSGYGAFSRKSAGQTKNYDAHRYVCTLAHGPADAGMQASHSCGNKLCVNPKHLYWATAQENMGDAKRHGTLRGGGRYRQRIFSEDVKFIVGSTESYSVLAARYGVDVPYIGRIKRSAANG